MASHSMHLCKFSKQLDMFRGLPHAVQCHQLWLCPPLQVTTLIVSLKAAALGVNLTVANHVVLLDLWWNPTVEEQAIDRAHRIGEQLCP
jgi:hypothetical protein